MEANLLGALEAAEAIREGQISSEELIRACLSRIEESEESIGAWAFLDPEYALEQARNADQIRSRGGSTGPLHGVPVGIKDIIDTADMPTEYGTVIHSGNRPFKDATLVALLREAGALILGKTVTTELAVLSPGKTRNPHNPDYTPGGSSSGSAAAVAAGMIPLAVGTQTNGSVIRPASFCGVFGFKPTFGKISRFQVLKQSPALDTIGVFARSLEDLALIGEVLITYDQQDPAMKPSARMPLLQTMAEDPPVDPDFAFIRTPAWNQVNESAKDAFRELIEHSRQRGVHLEIIELPGAFDDVYEVHRQIMEADLAKNFDKEYRDSKKQLSSVLCELIERGQKVLATEYNTALERAAEYNEMLNEIFEEYDAILTPSTTGEAPKSLETTGSPVFCTIWTLCGVPALNLPVLQGENTMPIGVQLLSKKGDDARLFRTAAHLMKTIGEEQ
ncbi:MAG: amidase [SAR324 cluster bacterium]|nr:amidase [SAR324 cluster bacterium]